MEASPFPCEYCGRHARGYCAVCGRLVCDEHSRMVGYARVCQECAERYGIESPEDIRRIQLKGLWRGEVRELLSVGEGAGEYVFIGMDDFDSPYGMCTTYLGARIALRISEFSEFLDYPLLVRLNPNVPIKTRGNAAVGMRVRTEEPERVEKVVLEEAGRLAHAFFRKTRPAIVLIFSRTYAVPKLFRETYWRALRRVVDYKELISSLRSMRVREATIKVYAFSEEPRGIVGAASAVGAEFPDWTYELLAYRKGERWVDISSLREIDEKYHPWLFDNLDGGRALIMPRGPDPVLLGIRGESPEKVLEAFSELRHSEIEMWAIFRTNQGTALHIVPNSPEVYVTTMMEGKVLSVRSPEEAKLLVEAETRKGRVLLHAYKIQGRLRRELSELRRGDRILFVANIWDVLEDGTLMANIEEFSPLVFVPDYEFRNPYCPVCGRRMKSKGSGVFYCRRCGYRVSAVKIVEARRRRPLPTRKRFLPPPRAHRHLTMPEQRMPFRFLKLAGRWKPRLISPFLGREKPENATFVRRIEEPPAF